MVKRFLCCLGIFLSCIGLTFAGKLAANATTEEIPPTEEEIIAEYKKQQEELTRMISYAISGSNYELSYSGGIMIWRTYTTSYITSPFGFFLYVRSRNSLIVFLHLGLITILSIRFIFLVLLSLDPANLFLHPLIVKPICR